jgi:hypothetical protein
MTAKPFFRLTALVALQFRDSGESNITRNLELKKAIKLQMKEMSLDERIDIGEQLNEADPLDSYGWTLIGLKLAQGDEFLKAHFCFLAAYVLANRNIGALLNAITSSRGEDEHGWLTLAVRDAIQTFGRQLPILAEQYLDGDTIGKNSQERKNELMAAFLEFVNLNFPTEET